MNDLCPTCGAYWDCGCPQQREVVFRDGLVMETRPAGEWDFLADNPIGTAATELTPETLARAAGGWNIYSGPMSGSGWWVADNP